MDITIIADNGGGLTLQIITETERYQHTYDDANQCARDIRDAVEYGEAEGFDDWTGNEQKKGLPWLEVDDAEIANGGYRVFRYPDLPNDPDTSWHNVVSLVHALDGH